MNQKKICNIYSTEVYDLNKFKEVMKEMMFKFNKAFGAPDSTSTDNAKIIDEIDFDINTSTITTFNYNSSWPIKIIKTGIVKNMNSEEIEEKRVVTTILIK